MLPTFIKEYYMHDEKPLVVFMKEDRTALRAWYPDFETRKMETNLAVMLDIVDGHHEGKITEAAFLDYCKAHKINADIPTSSLAMAFNRPNMFKIPTSLQRIITGPSKEPKTLAFG